MTRRAFTFSLGALGTCLGLGGALRAAEGQQPALRRRIGVLLVLLSPEGKEAKAFRQGLQDAGYVEGRDVVIEWRSANGDYTRLPQLAANLVEHKVDVIVADTTQATQAAQRATSTVPIVMAIVADPVGSGVVKSLAQPGGNVTGLSIMLAELSAKRLQLLKEAMPSLTRVVVLWNPPTAYHTKAVENLKAVAPSLAIELSLVSARTPEEIGPAFGAINRARAEALYVVDCPPFFTHRTTLLKLAAQARLGVISGERPYADEGARSCPTGRATRTSCADRRSTSTRSSKAPNLAACLSSSRPSSHSSSISRRRGCSAPPSPNRSCCAPTK